MKKSQKWQDWVISVGQVIFFIALLPSIFGDGKPEWSSSLLTALVLTVFAYTFATLKLAYGSAASALCAFGWWVLFFQVAF